MGLLTALMVFLFPIGMPVVTLVVVLRVALSRHPLATKLLRGLLCAVALAIVLGRSISRDGAGAFLLPWWLMPGSENYSWQYFLLVLSGVVGLSAGIQAVRALRNRP